MILNHSYIVFSATDTIEKTSIRERFEIDAELTNLLDEQGITYKNINVNTNSDTHPAILTAFTLDKLETFKMLAGDFGVNAFYILNGDKSLTVYTQEGETSYDSYTVSSTKPIENYIELSTTNYISL